MAFRGDHRHLRALVLLFLSSALAAALLSACADDDEGGSTTTSSVTSSTDGGSTSSSASSTSSSSSSTTTSGATAGTVEVWFSSGDGGDCAEVAAFPRPVDPGADPIRAAFDALVAGPTADEEALGAGSFFSADTADTVESVTLRTDGLLIVDFGDIRPLIPNASTSCGSAALRAQLDATAFQFDDVARARYRIAGSCDDFGNLLQTECFDSDRSGAQLPVPTNERASGSGCTPPSTGDLADGRWYGLVDEARAGELDFDLACWFSGTAAVAAASEDGEESPPPNDYYVRNTNEQLRTLPVASGTQVSWYPDGGDPADVVTVGYDTWRVDREARGFQFAVWLIVDGGAVTTVEEQWVP